jgi:hypothetical protein
MRPPISRGEWLHVVSQSDHQINLLDCGFIGPTGALLSLPQLDNDHPGPGDEQVSVRGSTTFEKRGDLFEIGPIDLPDKQIGATVWAGVDKGRCDHFDRDYACAD